MNVEVIATKNTGGQRFAASAWLDGWRATSKRSRNILPYSVAVLYATRQSPPERFCWRQRTQRSWQILPLLVFRVRRLSDDPIHVISNVFCGDRTPTICSLVQQVDVKRRGHRTHHLTTQAQRPGARDASIATATLPPGSLQRLVGPPDHAGHRFAPVSSTFTAIQSPRKPNGLSHCIFECLIVEASSQAQNHLSVLADRYT